MQICENGDMMHVCTICSVYRCAQACSVSLQSDIATCWPGMQNAAFLVALTDQCERGLFWQFCCQYAKPFKNAQEKLFCF